MDQRQHLDAGLARDRGGLPRRRVTGLGGPLGLVVAEAAVVDQDGRALGGRGRLGTRRRVPRQDDAAAAPRLAHHVGRTHRALAPLDLLAALQGPERRPRIDAEPPRGLGIEAARPILLDERVAERPYAVADREGADLVAIVHHGLVVVELDQLERIARPADDPLDRLEELDEAARAVDAKRPLAILEVVGLEQAGDPEVMIGMKVGQVDAVELDEPDRAMHLPLRALAAVEQQPLPAAAHEDGCRGPARGRHRAPGPEEDDRKVHGSKPMADPEPPRPLAAHGHDLALCARRTERLDELRAEIVAAHPDRVVAVKALDVTDDEAVFRVFHEFDAELGGVDRVVVNAGLGKGAPYRRRRVRGQQGRRR